MMKIFAFSAFTTAVVCATSVSVSTAATHAPVFLRNAQDLFGSEWNTDCHTIRSKDQCVKSHCLWCRSSAVPSACYTEEEGDQLPPAVFECDKSHLESGNDDDMWAIKAMPMDVDRLFGAWQRVHGKQYESAMESEMRRAVFAENAGMIATHNSRNDVSFTMELNQFADLTWSEFKKWHLGAPQSCSATHTSSTGVQYSDNVPEAKDWRAEGAVTPVKNQGKCGSCWTFSSTGCLESHHILKHNTTVLLSEQNLLDCAQAFDNHGCNGGLPSHAFEYIHYNGGLDTEESYPYTAKEEKCKFNAYHVGVQVDAVVNITSLNEQELKQAVGTVGPVSIAFQVVSDFRFYKSGVYESKDCHSGEQDVNHAVLAVGYGTEQGSNKKHWIVKNSWSAQWGMDGYFEIKRDENMCGVAVCASYPVIR